MKKPGNYHVNYQQVLDDQHSNNCDTRVSLPQHHRQRVDLLYFVHLILVDELSKDHPRHTQGLWQVEMTSFQSQLLVIP